MLLKGGKTLGAAFGMAALTGMAAPSVLSQLTSNDYGFIARAERDAGDELTYNSPQETCTLTGALTLGPCYAANAALVRRDITTATPGLPMRLGFRIIRASDCQPVTNATVDVWHVHALGIYSALTAPVCTTGANVVNETWCRGVQPTDSNGIAYFDSIYPGWYSGRTTHIHLTVRIGGNISVTTQFAFAERVNDFIYRKHPMYNTRPGTRTTNNSNDNIFNPANIATFSFNTRYKNNQLHAFKTIAIA